ncbi:MAG: hypothetical protein AAGC64_13340 [Bacteroidota bacterium]
MRPEEVAHHTEVQSAERRGAEIVDRAGLDTRIFALPREVRMPRVGDGEVSRSHTSV